MVSNIHRLELVKYIINSFEQQQYSACFFVGSAAVCLCVFVCQGIRREACCFVGSAAVSLCV